MNIQQLQYVLAVAETRHFEKASFKCHITQSTLSTMISKFEDEIGIKVFDRKQRPVGLTTEGELLIEQIKVILKEIDHLGELTKEIKGEVKGELTISVIPTIAPFLLPLFLQSFADRFPNLNIRVKEQTTTEILRNLKSRDLDIGILSIPVKDADVREIHLYDEPFQYFDAGREMPENVSMEELEVQNLCLLEEGHCMRTQVIELCDSHEKHLNSKLNFEYRAGSIDSLLRFVKANEAATLLPFLSTLELSDKERKHLSEFREPVPFRKVGIVVHRHFVKKRILEMLQADIMEKVREVLPEKDFEGAELSPV